VRRFPGQTGARQGDSRLVAQMTPTLIAHRGEPVSFPENSIAGYEAVLQAGANWIETDVQITADGVPVLCHDPSLLKLTGHDLNINTTVYADMQDLPAGYPDRFGDRFSQLRISRLDEFARLLSQWPQARAFVELKQPSLMAHDVQRVIDIVLEALAPCLSQSILISFEYAVLVHIRRCCELPIAWVLPEWSTQTQQQAMTLQPEFLFCNRKRLPDGLQQLWPGPWTWAIYTVNTSGDARRFAALGAGMIETDVIREFMQRGSASG
jgi:glycerophosphoryl diester phosphodiesterase